MIAEIRVSSPRAIRLIAFGRLVLIAPLVVWLMLDPAHLADPAAVVLIAAYAAYALALLGLLHHRRLAYRIVEFPHALHLIDFAFGTALLYSTSGADSPFFGPLVFLTVSATVQWGFRGTVATGLAVLLAYLPSGIMTLTGEDSDRQALLQFTVRLGYLSAIIVLLAALARHFERIVAELGRLSDAFPPPSDDALPPVHDLLCHAMRVFAVDHVAIVWRVPGARTAQLLTHSEAEGFVTRALQIAPEAPLVAADGHAALLCERLGGSFVRTDVRVLAGPVQPFAASLRDALRFGRALALRAACEGIDGWVIVLDHQDAALEDLAIAAMVSAQICLELDRWRNQRARETIIAAEERIRLGRDLHDGVVQSLAGVGFQLDTLADEPLSPHGRTTIAKLREALSREQRELRRLIQRVQPASIVPPAPPLKLDAELRELGEQLAGYWNVQVGARVTPEGATFPARLAEDLGFLIREGVANAVRHGKASMVELVAHAEDDCLALEIDDNGCGFGFDGERAHSELQRDGTGPRSLFERTCRLGGFLSIASARNGAQIAITIPTGVPS